MKASITKNKILSITFATSSILLLLLFWIILTNIYNNSLIFPSIGQIFTSMKEILSSISSLKAIGMTILRSIIAVAICLVICLLIAMVGYYSKTLYVAYPLSVNFFKPLIRIMRSVPLAILSIFIFILIGSKKGPYVITILMTLPVVFEGLILGVNEIPEGITDELKMLNVKTSQKIIDIYIPMMKPYIIMSIVQALGMSFKVLIMGEYICQTKNSIGKELYNIKIDLDMASLLAYGILIVIIVFVLEIVVNKLKEKLN